MSLLSATPPTDLGLWLLVVGVFIFLLVIGGLWADRIDRRNPR